MSARAIVLSVTLLTLPATLLRTAPADSQQPLKFFISVDLEGIGGVGSPLMTSTGGKDYGLSRQFLTREVNSVVAAIFERIPEADILVNDSHGDHQNVLHGELDPKVSYIQGSIKPLGMVQGLESSFNGVIFVGYHAKAGDPDGFLAHTGSGSVKGLWLNDVEVGEGGMNAAFAGSLGVPVILVAGDSAATAELGQLLGTETVTTKIAETPSSARLLHPDVVNDKLHEATGVALNRLENSDFDPLELGSPVEIRMRFASTTHVDVLQSIPGMSKIDGFTIRYVARNMDEAYRLIRLMYRFVSA
ncbi:MAG: M55 family metallopeptidase [Gemmatimonadota bacterium]|nr:M55 family metallopeptidase [Gemmatimonadota bacterium]